MTKPAVVQPETHRRAHARLRVGIAARFETLDGQEAVRLVDLSQSGAHIVVTGAGEIRRGVLCWLQFEAFGDVVWRDGDDAGIEFEELLPIEQLMETRERAPSIVRDEALGDRLAARDFVAGSIDLGAER